MLRNEGMEPISFDARARDRLPTSRTSCPSRSTTSRSATRPREAAAATGRPGRTTPRTTSSSSPTPRTPSRTQVILSQRGDDERERDHVSRSSWRRARRWDLQLDVVPSIDGSEVAPKLVERRFGDELVHVRDSLAAWQLRVPQLRAGWEDLEHCVRPVGVRPRVAADAERDRSGEGAASRSRDAVVHDRLRPRHDHHVPADAALRPGARAHRARGAGRAPGARGRSVDRRRAGEDRPRGAHRQGREALVPDVLRHRRRDAALPRAALRGLALDGRHLPRARAEGARAPRARVDRQVGRPRRRRLRRVPAAQRPRAREPVVEGLGRLAALRRRPHRADPDRAVPRCRATSTTRSGAWPSSRARSGATASSPTGSNREAEELRDRFDEAFWVEASGGYFALALDRDKQRVDSLCSNIGHLLWSGIVHPHRVDAVVDTLMGDALWSGWGDPHDVRAGRRVQPALVPQRNRLASRQFARSRGGSRATAAGRRCSASRSVCSRPRATSTTSCPRSSRACAAPRRRSRSRTRRPRVRRPGRRGRRCCCCSCCSGCSRTAGATRSRRSRRRSCRRG